MDATDAPSSNPRSKISIDDMKVAIGSLVFLCARAEQELASSVELLDPKQSGKAKLGFGNSLARWLALMAVRFDGNPEKSVALRRVHDRLNDARKIRNLVCHCLTGLRADTEHTGERASLSVSSGSVTTKLTWDDLQITFGRLSRDMMEISALTHLALRKNPS